MRQKDVIKLGAFLFNPITYELSLDGTKTLPELTNTEAKLLIYLYENSDRIISRDELLKYVASERVVDGAILTQYIKTIRKILGDSARNPRYIRTHQKHGYQFIAPLGSSNKISKRYWEALSSFFVIVIIAVVSQISMKNEYKQTNLPYPLTSLKGQELFGTTSKDKKYFLFSHKANTDNAYWQLTLKFRHEEEYKQLTLENANHINAKFSPSGNKILYHVYSDSINEIRISEINWNTYQLENTSVIATLLPNLFTVYFTWQDNNNFYYSSKDSSLSPVSIKLRNIESNEEKIITQPTGNGAGDLALVYSQPLQKLAFLRNIGYSKTDIYTYDKSSQEFSKHISLPTQPFNIDWAESDNPYIIVKDSITTLSLVDINTNEIKQILNTRYPIYSPFLIDDNNIGFMQGDFIKSDIVQHSLYAKTKTEDVINSSGTDTMLVIAQRTGAKAFLSDRTGISQIWLNEPTGKLRQITNFNNSEDIRHLAISPDADYIAYTLNATIFLMNSKRGTIEYTIKGDEKSYIDPEFGKDSKFLYYTYKLDNRWFIEKRSLDNFNLETVLTEGYLAKPCQQINCYYYLRVTDKALMKRTGLDSEIDTGIRLESVNYANQFDIVENSVYYAIDTINGKKLFRHDIGTKYSIELMDISSIHFSIYHKYKQIFYADRRLNDTNLEGTQFN